MNKLILSFLITLYAYAVNAQDFQVSIGQPHKVPATSSSVCIGSIDKNIYSIDWDYQKKRHSLSIYNGANLTFANSAVIKAQSCGKNKDCIDRHFDYERTLFMKDKMFMLVSTYEKQNNEKQLYAQEIDKSGKFIGQKRLIDKYETNKKKRAHYSEWFSDDRSKFMTILHPDEDKKASEKFFIKVYDSELNNLLNTQVTLPYEDENVGVEDYYLTNDGLVVMLVEIDKEAKETSKTDDDKKYELLVLDQKGTLNKFNIAISKKSIQSIGVRINDKEGKIICSGLYADITSSANKVKDIDGLFYLNIDIKSLKVLQEGYKKLSDEIVDHLKSNFKSGDRKEKRKNKKKDSGISVKFEITDILHTKDGGMMILSEMTHNYTVTTTSTDSNGNVRTYTVDHYERGNVLVSFINKDGEITQYTDIPKFQHTTSDGGTYSSYMLFEKDDRVFIIYHDDPKNFSSNIKSARDISIMSNPKTADLVAVEILPDGKYTKRRLFNNGDKNLTTYIHSAEKIGNGEYVLPYFIKPKMACFRCSCTMLFNKDKTGLMKFKL